MAITSYAELQTAVANWLSRSDLSSYIPDFITLAEKEISRRLRKETVRAAFDITGQATALPADCAELRSIRLNTASYQGPLDILTPEALADRLQAWVGASGVPRWASIVDGTLLVAPSPDGTYTTEIIYFQALTPLSGGSPTNSTLTDAPDLYLFGALKEAEPFLEHDERVDLWTTKFESALTALDLARQSAELGANPRPARLPVVF